MIPEPDDPKAFRKHIENMKDFRCSHHDEQRNAFRINETPVPSKTGNVGSDIEFLNAKGRPVIVPIWKIEPVEGSQN